MAAAGRRNDNSPRSATVLDTKLIKQQIKTLQERSDALRGYL